ncbi:MAG: hypothetical protein IJW99_12345 [Clostridia bacterium]|nr:hypothetical protein [Clostridia bacterium]
MTEQKQTQPFGAAQLDALRRTMEEYRRARREDMARLEEQEQWWRLRNTDRQAQTYALAADGGHHSASAWLHNVIVSKHADAMDAYPIPHILPREEDDAAEAARLCEILPRVLEMNSFEQVFSDVTWQKLKTGTGIYRVTWDARKLGGLGDIAITRIPPTALLWQPGICDIQKSAVLFHVESVPRAEFAAAYPAHADLPAEADGTVTVTEAYYRKEVEGRRTLQYCRFARDVILCATENDPELCRRGLYDHGKYPFVFDPLFPLEGSPCGYGYIDLCRGPQTELDLLKTAFVRNALVGAMPRYFARGEGVNEEELLDLTRPLVHVSNASEDALRPIVHNPLPAAYIDLYDRTVKELRETSGNTEAGTGNISQGVTAASAINALREASGKGSRDSNASARRAFCGVVELCIELIRQFYTLPRRFRLDGGEGEVPRFVRYSADGIRPIPQTDGEGRALGYRLPVFDIHIKARHRDSYSAATQNALATELFRLGFFDPARRREALAALSVMDFEGKELIAARLGAEDGGEVRP